MRTQLTKQGLKIFARNGYSVVNLLTDIANWDNHYDGKGTLTFEEAGKVSIRIMRYEPYYRTY